jgi:hypothetical protein
MPACYGNGMEASFRRALLNIVSHGDTDIFPFPIETRLFSDEQDALVKLLLDINKNLTLTLQPQTKIMRGSKRK